MWPSLVVFIDAHPEVVADRLNDRHLDRFERAGAAFHQRVLDGYHQLIADDPERWIVVTTAGSKSEVAADVLDAVRRRALHLGAGLCYMFSGQFAKLATLRYTLILPTVLSIIYIGAFQELRHWGDIYTLLTSASSAGR